MNMKEDDRVSAVALVVESGTQPEQDPAELDAGQADESVAIDADAAGETDADDADTTATADSNGAGPSE
jgi:hypothetical protein